MMECSFSPKFRSLNSPIDKFSIRAPACPQVFPNGPEFFRIGQRGHGMIILPSNSKSNHDRGPQPMRDRASALAALSFAGL